MMDKQTGEWSLADMIEQGGVYYGIRGVQPREILAAITGLVPPVPSLEKKALLEAVLEREALMSTGIGKGIALPHPRSPLLGEGHKPFVAIGFTAVPIDWNTPDGSKVYTVFLIVSSSAKQHLNTLSKINFLCQQEQFLSLIKAQGSKEAIVAAVREAEAAWAGTSK
jgi:PTS system nitrogen regulatory IIA component